VLIIITNWLINIVFLKKSRDGIITYSMFILLPMLKDGIDDYDNQDEWLHRNNNFSRDWIVNVDVVGDESTLLENAIV
jgi:hypothetical protein